MSEPLSESEPVSEVSEFAQIRVRVRVRSLRKSRVRVCFGHGLMSEVVSETAHLSGLKPEGPLMIPLQLFVNTFRFLTFFLKYH